MKTFYLAGPRYDVPVGEKMAIGLFAGVPMFDTTDELLASLIPGSNAEKVEVLRVTVESIPYPAKGE